MLADVSDPGVARAKVSVASIRLTDTGDNDGFADPQETVQVYVTLRNDSGSDRQGIVVRMGSTDPTVACIPTPVVSFGALLDGETREASLPLVFLVANLQRADYLQDLPVTLEFVVSGDDFDTTTNPQSVTQETDLNVSGGILPTSFSEGFESGTFGSFTTQSLDVTRESLAASDGFRCQYNDPDFANSNSYGNTKCFLGAATPAQNAYDWHVHGLASPDGGRAYLGNNSLHWGVHPGGASADTTRLKQLDAIRTTNTVNLGWNGAASELSFKHQVGLIDCDYVSCDVGTIDRGIVQVQLATSAGQGVGNWRKISPYENVYDMQTLDNYTTCMFDPVDDGNTEDDYFDPADPGRRLGPSSTCYPEFAFSRQGEIAFNAPFREESIGHASDGPGLQGIRGPGTWVQTKFRLDRWRGRRLRMRFLTSSIEGGDALTAEQLASWNPIEADDGWYIDDIKVTNTLTSAAALTVDTADRSGLPACGPVCGSLAPSLAVTPASAQCDEAFTLDAAASAADQCPGGALQFRFWWIWGSPPPYGDLNEVDAALLQDWNENGILSHPAQTTGAQRYRVDVRCSTLPACGGSTETVVAVDPSCPVIVFFPYTVVFDSKTVLSWGAPTTVSGVLGDLGTLRASGGDFNQGEHDYFGSVTSHYEDLYRSVPLPGEGYYYLVHSYRSRPPHGCIRYSWSTGSPAEVPGAGGTRDEDLDDVEPCP